VAYPIGWAGCGLIWYTIFTKWRHGLSENDDLIMSLGYLLIIAGDIIQAVCYLLMRDFADACATGPKTKKKIKKLLGDKAKAAKAKMLKKMREAGDHLPKPGEWLPSPVPA
jgi:hypothetical protein